MKRINQTELNERIKRYVINCISLEDYEQYNGLQMSEKDRLFALDHIFRKEYGHEIKRYGNKQRALSEWLKGLPPCFNIDFYDLDIVQRGIELGHLTESDSDTRKFINEWFDRIAMGIIHNLKRK